MTRMRLGIGMMIALFLAGFVAAALAPSAHGGNGQARAATRTDPGTHRRYHPKPPARHGTGLDGRWIVVAIAAIGDFRAPDAWPPLPRTEKSSATSSSML